MEKQARNVSIQDWGFWPKAATCCMMGMASFVRGFAKVIGAAQVRTVQLPAGSPHLNAYAERWVRSVKEECLFKVVLFGERSLRRAVSEYVEHYHTERNHQGKGNVLLFARDTGLRREQPVRRRERLGGLLRYYHQEAA